jgi:hypothetical protein
LVNNELSVNKWQRFDEFTKDLEPVIIQLNALMDKYKIFPIEDFILFPTNKKINKIEPFINYDKFPSFSEIKVEPK